MSNKPFIIVVAVLLIAIASVFGFSFIKDMPKVSRDESKEILTQYKNDLQNMYTELNSTYDGLKADADQAQWEKFSREWMPKLTSIRPQFLNEKLPGKYEDIKITLMTAQSDFIPLWNEYNKNFIGKKPNLEKIGELKGRIEKAFENADL